MITTIFYKADLLDSEGSREKIFEFTKCEYNPQEYKESLIKRFGNTKFKLGYDFKQKIYNHRGDLQSLIPFINKEFSECGLTVYLYVTLKGERLK